VIVTLRAPEREPEKQRAGGVGAVEDVVHPRLGRVASALAIGHVIAVETGGEDLLGGGIGQEITGELLEGELVEGHVRVEGVDDPIAPWPVATSGVPLEAVGIAVAGAIEPPHGHAFAEVRRGQQGVDHLVEAYSQLFGRGRQSGEVKGQPAPDRVDFCRRRHFKAVLCQTFRDEVVDGVGTLRNWFLLRADEGPVVAPLCPLEDPFF